MDVGAKFYRRNTVVHFPTRFAWLKLTFQNNVIRRSCDLSLWLMSLTVYWLLFFYTFSFTKTRLSKRFERNISSCDAFSPFLNYFIFNFLVIDYRLSLLVWIAMFISFTLIVVFPRPSGVRTFMFAVIVRLFFSIGLEATLLLLGIVNVNFMFIFFTACSCIGAAKGKEDSSECSFRFVQSQ